MPRGTPSRQRRSTRKRVVDAPRAKPRLAARHAREECGLDPRRRLPRRADTVERYEQSCCQAAPRAPSMTPCSHLDHVRVTELPESVDGCADCLAIGAKWLHLRICLECGHVGCCDDSPHRHATAHAESSGHPIIRSLEPGEEWSWCFIDQIGLLIPGVHGETRIPLSPLG